MKRKILVGCLSIIIIFFIPIWLTNRYHQSLTSRAITTHGESIIFIERKHKEMQMDFARLIESNDRLEKRLKRCEAINESFEKIVREKFPNFIE